MLYMTSPAQWDISALKTQVFEIYSNLLTLGNKKICFNQPIINIYLLSCRLGKYFQTLFPRLNASDILKKLNDFKLFSNESRFEENLVGTQHIHESLVTLYRHFYEKEADYTSTCDYSAETFGRSNLMITRKTCLFRQERISSQMAKLGFEIYLKLIRTKLEDCQKDLLECNEEHLENICKNITSQVNKDTSLLEKLSDLTHAYQDHLKKEKTPSPLLDRKKQIILKILKCLESKQNTQIETIEQIRRILEKYADSLRKPRNALYQHYFFSPIMINLKKIKPFDQMMVVTGKSFLEKVIQIDEDHKLFPIDNLNQTFVEVLG